MRTRRQGELLRGRSQKKSLGLNKSWSVHGYSVGPFAMTFSIDVYKFLELGDIKRLFKGIKLSHLSRISDSFVALKVAQQEVTWAWMQTVAHVLFLCRRGSMLSTAIFVYAATSPVNGYFGGSLYAKQGGSFPYSLFFLNSSHYFTTASTSLLCF